MTICAKLLPNLLRNVNKDFLLGQLMTLYAKLFSNLLKSVYKDFL